MQSYLRVLEIDFKICDLVDAFSLRRPFTHSFPKTTPTFNGTNKSDLNIGSTNL